MRAMRGWIREWILPEMYSGAPARGAEDAWYESSLEAKLAAAEGVPFTGGATDMYKCYDSIVRDTIYQVSPPPSSRLITDSSRV